MTIPPMMCIVCRHYVGRSKCKAFPKGIPKPILSGKNDHRLPYDGDNGIRFELVEKSE